MTLIDREASHQRGTKVNPKNNTCGKQFIKVVLNLQEEVRKLRKANEKLAEQIHHGLQDTLDLRMANQEGKLTLFGITSESNSVRRTPKYRKFKIRVSRLKTFCKAKEASKPAEYTGVKSKFRQDVNRKEFQIGNAVSTQNEKTLLLLQELMIPLKTMCSFHKNQGEIWKRQVQQSIMRKKNQIQCRENGKLTGKNRISNRKKLKKELELNKALEERQEEQDSRIQRLYQKRKFKLQNFFQAVIFIVPAKQFKYKQNATQLV